MERKLATIRIIKDIQPIENADRIELAFIDGWQVVVEKGLYQIGDYVVYCEIDSIFPEKPEFEFLRQRAFRIKTIKLRGQISQGIVFPMTILHGKKYITDTRDNPTYDFQVGTNVTELLGIKKYEPYIPVHLFGIAKGKFPSFIPKTDEERIQNIPYILEVFKHKQFYITEKLNGTSMTCYYYNGKFGVCSRNLDLKESDNVYWKVVKFENIKEKLEQADGWAIQGELIGDGIQGNRYGIPRGNNYFKIFNVFNIKNGKYMEINRMEAFCSQFGFYTVPILRYDFHLNHTMENLLAMADGESQLIPNTPREGLVFRAVPETFYTPLGRVSFKVISNKFLLKNKDE